MKGYLRRDISPTVSRFDYSIKRFEGIDALAEECYLPLTYCSYGYNITVKNGILTNGVGIELAEINGDILPSGISVGSRPEKAVVYRRIDESTGLRDDICVAIMHDKKIYYARFSEMSFTDSNISFSNYDVTFLNYHYNGRDCLLIMGEEGKSYIFDGSVFTKITGAPKLNAACVHNERVYGTVSAEGNRLYFSDVLDPTNWNASLTEGGYIDFPDEGGKVSGVLSFKNNLYIIREYAIHKLTAFADQSDYVLTKVFSTNNRIYPRTAAVCNNMITFLADDGFYRFDGYECKKFLKTVVPLIEDKTNAFACFFDNKYYLAVRLKRDGNVVGDEHINFTNNGMIIYDFDDDSTGIFRGADIGWFFPVSTDGVNKLFVLFGSVYRGYNFGEINDSGRLFEKPLKKLWKSPYTNFSELNRDKVLKKIYINADKALTLTARLDKDYVYSIPYSESSQMLPINKRAESVGLSISTDEDNFKVKGLLLEFDFIRRNYE